MLEIAESFVALTEGKPPEKISVSDIIARAGKNRKTFYYHFENKDKLIQWIFRYDMGNTLKQHFPESILVYEGKSNDAAASYPYYITQRVGVRSLNHAEFFTCFAEVLEGRRRFYKEALADSAPSALGNYLYDLYYQAIRFDIDLILSNRYLSADNAEFLANFYTGSFLFYFIHKIEQNGSAPLLPKAGSFSNIVHDSMEYVINESQLRRNL